MTNNIDKLREILQGADLPDVYPGHKLANSVLRNLSEEMLAVVEAAMTSHGAPEYDGECEICEALKASTKN